MYVNAELGRSRHEALGTDEAHRAAAGAACSNNELVTITLITNNHNKILILTTTQIMTIIMIIIRATPDLRRRSSHCKSPARIRIAQGFELSPLL